jgi:hypothetical protein
VFNALSTQMAFLGGAIWAPPAETAAKCWPVAGYRAATLIHNAVLPRAVTAPRYVLMMIADFQ